MKGKSVQSCACPTHLEEASRHVDYFSDETEGKIHYWDALQRKERRLRFVSKIVVR